MTLCHCLWLGCCSSTFVSLLEPVQRQPSRAGCVWDSCALPGSGFWAAAGWCLCAAKATSAPKRDLLLWGQPCGRGASTHRCRRHPQQVWGNSRVCCGCIHSSPALTETPGLLTWWVGAGDVLLCVPGQWGCVCPEPSEWLHDLVFLSAGLQLFLKGNFLKIHLFLSLIPSISLVSGYSNSRLFLLLWLNGKMSRCAAKEVSAFYNL